MNHSRLIALALLASGLQSFSVNALPNEQATQFKKTLQSTPAPELPAAAVKAIREAKTADKDQVTEIVLNSVAEKRPTSLPTVVASIAAAAPGSASKAAAHAAKVSPNQAASIALAASNAAPGLSDQITAAVRATSATAESAVPPHTPAENRPPITPGNIHGNRPTIPPGLEKKEYGSP